MQSAIIARLAVHESVVPYIQDGCPTLRWNAPSSRCHRRKFESRTRKNRPVRLGGNISKWPAKQSQEDPHYTVSLRLLARTQQSTHH